MKKNNLIVIVTMLLSIISCTEKGNTPEFSKIKVTLTPSLTDTKTSIEWNEDENVYIPSWSSTDKLGLFAINESDILKANNSQMSITSLESGIATSFSGEVTAPTYGTENYTFYAYYPYTNTLAGTSYSQVLLTVPSQQTPTTSSFDPTADVLVGNPIVQSVSSNDISLVIPFKRMTSVIKIKLVIQDGLTGTEKIKKIKLTVGTSASEYAITGNAQVNLSNPTALTSYSEAKNMVEASYSSDILIAESSIYLSVLPFTLSSSSSMTIRIETDLNIIEKTITGREIPFIAGDVTLLNMSISNATCSITDKDDPTIQEGGESVSSLLFSTPSIVSKVTGSTITGELFPNPNNTTIKYGMGSADYGNMWDAGNGTIMAVFGDNFLNAEQDDWKANAIAISSDRSLSNGLEYSGMIMDGSTRKEIITPLEGETACIPTAGVSVPTVGGNRQYLNYMSINTWNVDSDPDKWSVNYSEIVYSDNYGSTWTKSGVKWGATSNFAQVAYLKKDGIIYMYGTPSGRHGNIFLAKVAQDQVLTKSSYLYWNGTNWSSSESDAKAITYGSASEMSVVYNSYYDRYIMMYMSICQRAIVYRDATSPEGEWSGEKILFSDSGEGIYAPYIHPWSTDGKDLYFVVTHAVPTWNVYFMHSRISEDEGGFNMVTEGGFEDYPTESIQYKSRWYVPQSVSTNDKHSGGVACKLNNNSDFKEVCLQTVAVKKNTDYILSAYVKGSWDNITGGWFGVRKPIGGVNDYNPTINSTWGLIQKEFNSGDNTTVNVFMGLWGWENLYIIIDDIKLIPKQ